MSDCGGGACLRISTAMVLRPSRRSSSRTRSSSLRTSDAATTSSSKGDSDPNYTYISVGRVLSQWEGVEIELGYVYTAVAGNHGDWYKLLEYVEGSSFKGRFCIGDDPGLDGLI